MLVENRIGGRFDSGYAPLISGVDEVARGSFLSVPFVSPSLLLDGVDSFKGNYFV